MWGAGAPEYVVLGYDTELTYEKRTGQYPHAGVPLVASHPTWSVRVLMVGCPMSVRICHVQSDPGADPEHITGKPNAGMILHKIEALG